MYHLKSIFFYQKLVSFGEFEEDLLVQSCLNRWACVGKRPGVLGRLPPVPQALTEASRGVGERLTPSVLLSAREVGSRDLPAFLLHVL